MQYIIFIGLVLLVGIPALAWWAGRQFWRRSPADEPTGAARYRAVGHLVLLAGAWHLAVYCLTAVLLLPWGKGLGHGRSPSAGEWADAYLRHELVLLLLGLGGALTLTLLRHGWQVALSWLAGCLLVLGGFRAWRAHSRYVEEAENRAWVAPSPATSKAVDLSALPYTFTDSLGYTKLYQYYPARAPDSHALRIRRALRWDRVAVKPTYPGGEEALRLATRRLVRYPGAAQGRGLAKTLTVSCIVEADGHLTVMDVEALPAADPAAGLGFEAEAARAVQALPPFVPGRQAGQPVAVAHSIGVAILPPPTTSTQQAG